MPLYRSILQPRYAPLKSFRGAHSIKIHPLIRV